MLRHTRLNRPTRACLLWCQPFRNRTRPTCLARGATTVVDAGSAGADTFPGFRKYVIDVSDTRILAQLNISSQGMLTQEIGELENPDYADVGKACRMIEQHRDIILGVKVRLTRETIVGARAGCSHCTGRAKPPMPQDYP